MPWIGSFKDFTKRTGIICKFSQRNMIDVDDLVATAAYRITQEALTNVARHAFATQVRITLEGKNDIFILTVKDNGVVLSLRTWRIPIVWG